MQKIPKINETFKYKCGLYTIIRETKRAETDWIVKH